MYGSKRLHIVVLLILALLEAGAIYVVLGKGEGLPE
jgi:hypothetical protein